VTTLLRITLTLAVLMSGTWASEEAGVTVTGMLVDAKSGRPVTEALVYITSENSWCTTKSSNEFELQGVSEGHHTLEVFRMNYLPFDTSIQVNDLNLDVGSITIHRDPALPEAVFAAESTKNDDSQQRPVPPGRIKGYVLDLETGAPIPSVLVSIDSINVGGTTDDNGQFYINGVLPGDHKLKVWTMEFIEPRAEIVEVRSGECTDVDFSLRTPFPCLPAGVTSYDLGADKAIREALDSARHQMSAAAQGAIVGMRFPGKLSAPCTNEVRGIVVDDSTGESLGGCTLWITETNSFAQSRPDGTFRLERVCNGRVAVVCQESGYWPQTDTVTTCDSCPNVLTVALTRYPCPDTALIRRNLYAARLKGIYFDTMASNIECDLSDLSSVRLSLSGRVLDGSNEQAIARAAVLIGGQRIGTYTDSSGAFLITKLCPGTYQVSIYTDDKRYIAVPGIVLLDKSGNHIEITIDESDKLPESLGNRFMWKSLF